MLRDFSLSCGDMQDQAGPDRGRSVASFAPSTHLTISISAHSTAAKQTSCSVMDLVKLAQSEWQ